MDQTSKIAIKRDPLTDEGLHQFIQDTFYHAPNSTGSATLYFRQIRDGREDHKIILLPSFADAVSAKFGEPILGDLVELLLDLAPVVSGKCYAPGEGRLVKAENAGIYQANVWVPSNFHPSREPQEPVRPDYWQAYLERFMPNEYTCHFQQQDMPQSVYFETWLANRLFDPSNPPTVAILLRGDQGTGKGFVFDSIMRPLLGKSNYTATTLKSWNASDFTADIYDSVLLNLEECADSTKQTANKLKYLITAEFHRVNEKFVQQRTEPRYFGLVLSSNNERPLFIEDTDRRYFVPVFSKHPKSSAETNQFFDGFYRWLNQDGGYQQMLDHFQDLYFVGYPNFGPGEKWNWTHAPITHEKTEISTPADTRAETKGRVKLELSTLLDKHVFNTSTIQDRYKLTESEVRAVLKDMGLIDFQCKIQGENVRVWGTQEINHKRTVLRTPLNKQNVTLWDGRDGVSIREDGDPTEGELRGDWNR